MNSKEEGCEEGCEEACIILCMISISIIHVLCPSLFLLPPHPLGQERMADGEGGGNTAGSTPGQG